MQMPWKRSFSRGWCSPNGGRACLRSAAEQGTTWSSSRRWGLMLLVLTLPSPCSRWQQGGLVPGVRLSPGQANELGFNDNSFDIVALITLLEFVPDPAGALIEAVRVAREKVYVGVLNKASILGITRRVEGGFRKSIYKQARFYTIWEIEGMVKRALDRFSLTWESVLFFPLGWHRYCHRIDRSLSFHRNPFGAFLGICISKLHQTSTKR